MSFLDYDQDLYDLAGKMNPRQRRLFACDCAEHVLWVFEKHNPNDKRPRDLIEILRRFANDEVSFDETVYPAILDVESAVNENTKDSVISAAWAAKYAASTDLHLIEEINKPTASVMMLIAEEQGNDPLTKLIEFRKWQAQRAQAILDGLYDQE